MDKYIVRNPFVNYGKMYAAGSLIENPAEIKRIKSKVRNRDIVIVNEQTLALWAQYFKTRHRVDISAYFKKPVVSPVQPTVQNKGSETPVVKNESGAKTPEVNKEPVVAKPITEPVVVKPITEPTVVTAKVAE